MKTRGRKALPLRYRDRVVTAGDLETIRSVVRRCRHEGRTAASRELCEIWGWRQDNGCLKEIVCRGLLLRLEREGLVRLPAPKRVPVNPFSARRARLRASDGRDAVILADDPIPAGAAVSLAPARGTVHAPLYNHIVDRFRGPVAHVGEHLEYVVFAGGRPAGAAGFASPPARVGCRNARLGWPAVPAPAQLKEIASLAVLVILPQAEDPGFAASALRACARVVPEDWRRLYGHPVRWLEAIVPAGAGGPYRDAGWELAGMTRGRRRGDPRNRATGEPREVWLLAV